MRKFVIQEHKTVQDLHWDLMLEMDDCLWTWRVNVEPAELQKKLSGTLALPTFHLERIVDHPLRFLTYEGPVQNGTGQVNIADSGSYSLIENKDGLLIIDLQGQIVSGRLKIVSSSMI